MCCAHVQAVLTPPACGALNGGGQELLNQGQLDMSAKNALEFHVEATFRTPQQAEVLRTQILELWGKLHSYSC